ncbi:MAG: hypothetical protein RLZZ292_1577 [Bacteroidota bacterium]|jgi:hypothetical protein
MLTENSIFFSAPSSLNDPYDIVIPHNYRAEELTNENILKSLHQTKKPNITDEMCLERLNSGVFQNGKYVAESYPCIKDKVDKKVGVFCLSELNDDILMWGHYANCHQGYAVGFDSDELLKFLESHSQEDKVLYFGKVKYDDKLPYFPMPCNSNDTDDFKISLGTKFKNWEYEKEHRFLIINPNGIENRVVKFPCELVIEVIIGERMDNESRNEIFFTVLKNYPNAVLKEVKLNLHTYKLEIEEITDVPASLSPTPLKAVLDIVEKMIKKR